MVVKVSCPECETITEYTGEVKKDKFVTCSNPDCRFPSGKRRRIKVIPNVILGDTSDTNNKTSETNKKQEKEKSDTEKVSPVIPSDTKSDTSDTKKKPQKSKVETQRKQETNKSDTMIPGDIKKSVSRIIELLKANLDSKEGFFWELHQKMSTRRSFPNELMTQFHEKCLELKKELDKIGNLDNNNDNRNNNS